MGRHRDPDRPDGQTLARLCEKHNATQIAAIYAKDVKTIYNWCRQEGVHPIATKGRGRKTVDVENVIRLADNGTPMTEIAELYGVSTHLLVRRLADVGWTKPTHEVEDPKGVNCMDNPKICDSCHYGSGGTCLYILYGHGRRPCPANDCTVYKKREPGHRIDGLKGRGVWYD